MDKNKKNYWRSTEEFDNPEALISEKKDEFTEPLPLEEYMNDTLLAAKTSRRNFLKFMGIGTAAATLAACTETPVKNAIPFLNKPEENTPGKFNFYASSLNGKSVIVRTRDGRPTKIEGNKMCKITRGAASSLTQGEILSLYNNRRLKKPTVAGKAAKWYEIDGKIRSTLSKAGKIHLVTSSIISPVTRKLLKEFKEKYPQTNHVPYAPISYSGLLDASKDIYGKRFTPNYNFEKAEVIVSLDADFLGTWLFPEKFAAEYSAGRKLDPKKPKMNQHFQFESMMSLTGSNADYRYKVKPSEIALVAANLYNAIAGSAGKSQVSAAKLASQSKSISFVAKHLTKYKGKSLVVSGSNDKNVQLLVYGINEMLGNIGSTVDVEHPIMLHQNDDKKMDKFVESVSANDAVIFWDVNPVYDYYNGKALEKALKGNKNSISISISNNETTKLCQFALASHHQLESWDIHEPIKTACMSQQPMINPLFDTRAPQENFMKWIGSSEEDYYAYVEKFKKEFMHAAVAPEKTYHEFSDDFIHNGAAKLKKETGETEGKTEKSDDEETSANGFDSALMSKAASALKVVSKGTELVLYQKIGIGDGRLAANPFLHELPDPITKVTWDNYVCIPPSMEKDNLKFGYTAKVTVGKNTVELPVLVQPGLADNTIAIALGYGSEESKKIVDSNVIGQNAYPFLTKVNGAISNYVSGASVSGTSNSYKLALTQTHHTIDDGVFDGEERRDIVKEATFAEYVVKHNAANDEHAEIFSLYEDKEYPTHHWGMSIDLTLCTGCGDCVTSCNYENNIAVVGRDQVQRRREMHWLRIDRYYEGEKENPSVVYQPVMCQQCDDAPCENVCPVLATVHSNEGLNMQAYNRCIGTRYCANNCPYKVRRFNWYDFNGADSFSGNEMVIPAFEDNELYKFMLNPDVTVRSRGVMEKCSFCAQRLQAGKLEAKMQNRELKDGEIEVACESVCSAGAIVFGDMNDKNSRISKLNKNQRSYHLLKEVKTLPSVSYMVKIRNRETEIKA